MSVTSDPSRSSHRPADLESRVGGVHGRHGHPAHAQKHRAVHRGGRAHRLRGLDRVGRHDHRQVGDRARPGQILDRVMRGPELAVGHAARHAAQLHVVAAVAEVDLDLLERAAGQEARCAARERDLAGARESGAHAHEVLLGDADVDQPVGKAALELLEVRRAHRVVGRPRRCGGRPRRGRPARR